MSGTDKPLMPEDSLDDPELDFEEAEFVEQLTPMLAEESDDTEAHTLAEDANVPLDVEPDPVLPTETGFEEEIEAEPTRADTEKLQREVQSLQAALEQERVNHETVTRKLQRKLQDAAPESELAQRQLAEMTAQILALQQENAKLKGALRESGGEAGHQVAELREQLATAQGIAVNAEDLARENQSLARELEQTRKELRDIRDGSDQFERGLKDLDERKAEMATLGKELESAREQVRRLQELEREAQRVEALEGHISQLQDELVTKEKEVAEVQEKLDTEAARSYRLSQRRIPALNREIEETHEHNRELERRLQKAELKAKTYEEQAKELRNQVADLERALQGAKARAQDTAIIASGDDAALLINDEVRRLSNRLREIEVERAALAAGLRQSDEAHRAEVERLEARTARIEQENDERHETVLKQRTQLRVLRERVSGMVRLAQDLSRAERDHAKPLLDAIRKLGDLPPEAD
jgi:chromosome segregation ATPase